MRDILETGLLFEATDTIKQNDILYVVGIVQRANAKNKNGRIYPKAILEKKVNDYIEEFVKNKNAYGELDHPESSVVELKNASHTIEDLWWVGDDLYAKLEILPTPAGDIVASLFERKKTVGISSRAIGSVAESFTEDGSVEVQEDLELICWDIVSNPSTHRAFLNPVKEGKMLRENKEYKINQNFDNIINDIICNITGKCSLENK